MVAIISKKKVGKQAQKKLYRLVAPQKKRKYRLFQSVYLLFPRIQLIEATIMKQRESSCGSDFGCKCEKINFLVNEK